MTFHEPLRIRVQISNSGLLIANSPDLPGLHVAERTEKELIASLYELIPFLFAERGESVTVVDVSPVNGESSLGLTPGFAALLKEVPAERATC